MHESSLAHTVIDHVHTPSTGYRFHTLSKIDFPVQNRVMAAMFFSQPGFFDRTDGSNHLGAQVTGPLRDDRTHTPGGRVNQDAIAALYRVASEKQVSGRHPPQHHARRRVGGDSLRKQDQPVRRDTAYLSVGPRRNPGITHPVSGLEAGDIGAYRLDHAGAFQAQHGRKRRQRIEPGTMVNVDKIEPDGLLTQPHCTRARQAGVVVFPFQDGRVTRCMNDDCFGHG